MTTHDTKRKTQPCQKFTKSKLRVHSHRAVESSSKCLLKTVPTRLKMPKPSFRLRSHEQVQKGSRRATIRRIDGLLFQLQSHQSPGTMKLPALGCSFSHVETFSRAGKKSSTIILLSPMLLQYRRIILIKSHNIYTYNSTLLQYDLPSLGQSLDPQTIPTR